MGVSEVPENINISSDRLTLQDFKQLGLSTEIEDAVQRETLKCEGCRQLKVELKSQEAHWRHVVELKDDIWKSEINIIKRAWKRREAYLREGDTSENGVEG